MRLRPATPADSAAIDRIHVVAFDGEVEAALVRAILADPTATPIVSMVATADDTGEVIGHVLFSAAWLETPQSEVSATLLAPLAVAPGHQGAGIGAALVTAGFDAARAAGAALAFVLGDPAYYGRFGFVPAMPHRFAPPHALPEAHLEAWQVRALGGDLAHVSAGTLRCCAALDRPEIWQG